MKHEQITKEHLSSDTLVLFVHGFMGSPIQFGSWIDACYAAGWSVLSVLLPGHGVDGLAFASNALTHWEAHVHELIARYRPKYQHIVVVGHSMGGLLLLNETLRVQPPLDGAFLIAPPIQINLRYWSIKRRAQMALMNGHPDIWQAYQRVYGVGKAPLYLYPLWLRQFLSLKLLIEKTKRNLPKVQIPVQIVHSLGDEMVSIKSADSLMHGLQMQDDDRIRLDESWHAYYTEQDTRRITQALIAFVRRVVE